jgi:hypothetical protein
MQRSPRRRRMHFTIEDSESSCSADFVEGGSRWYREGRRGLSRSWDFETKIKKSKSAIGAKESLECAIRYLVNENWDRSFSSFEQREEDLRPRTFKWMCSSSLTEKDTSHLKLKGESALSHIDERVEWRRFCECWETWLKIENFDER